MSLLKKAADTSWAPASLPASRVMAVRCWRESSFLRDFMLRWYTSTKWAGIASTATQRARSDSSDACQNGRYMQNMVHPATVAMNRFGCWRGCITDCSSTQMWR